MAYMQLVGELKINTRQFEQGLEFADSMGKAFVRPTRIVKLGLDFKALDSQLKQAESRFKATLKPITLPIELQMRVNGQQIVIEQSKLAEKTIRSQETATKQLASALKALEGKGYGAFAGTLKGATDAEAALNRAKAKLRELGTIKPPSSAWSMPVGSFNKVKEAEADLKRLGASLERDAKFTQDFNAHLQKMQGLIDGAAAKGEKLGTQIANRLLAAAKNAEGANNAFSLMGRGLSAIGAIGSGVSRVLLGLGRNLYNFAMTRVLMPALYRSMAELREMTLGYSITLERARTSLTSMMGNSDKAASGLLDTLESFAIRTQFNFDDLAGLTPQLKVAKIATADLIPTFTALGDAVTASAKGREGLKNLVGDLVSMSARGKVTGMDVRNFGANGVNIVTYLAQAYSTILPKGTKAAEMAMRSMISKGLIPAEQGIKAIVEGIGNDPLKSGQMAKQAKTFEGAMSNIGDALKRVFGKEAFGQTFQYLTERVNKFLNIVSSPAMLQWGKDMGPKVLAISKGFAEFGAVVIRFGADVYNVGVDVVGVLGRVAQAVTFTVGVGKKLLPILEAAAVGVALSFARVGAIATWAFVRTLPASIATGVASLRQFVALARTAQVAWAYVPAVILAGVVAATEAFSSLVDKGYDAFEHLPGAAGKYFKEERKGWEQYKKDYSDGFDVLKGIAQEKMAKIADFFMPDMSKFKIDLKGMEKMLKDAQLQSVFGDATAGAFAPFGLDDLNTNTANAAAKLAARLKKLENDRLADSAALYDAMASKVKKFYDDQAKAAEDSAKRQVDALKSIKDKFADLVGDFQDSLSRYGLLSSPLDAVIAKLQNVMAFGPRMAQATKDAIKQIDDIQNRSLSTQQTFQLHALHAKMAQDKLNGGDGREPARQFKLDQIGSGNFPVSTGMAGKMMSAKELGTAAILKLAQAIPQVSIPACANFAGALLNRVGVAIPRTNIARDLARNAKDMGARRISLSQAGAGDLIVYRGPSYGSLKFNEGGQKVGYHVMVGTGNGNAIGRNHSYQGPIQAPRRGNEGYAYDTSVLAKGTKLVEHAVAALNKATGAKVQTGIDENVGQGLAQSLMDALQNLSLSKLTPLPKSFGAPIKEAEGHMGRFKVQTLIANTELQNLLRVLLGADFDSAMKRLGELGDTFDRIESRQRGRAETFELWAKQRMRGQENNPLAQFFFKERPGGPLEFLKPDTRIRAQANQLRVNPFVAAPGAAQRLDAQFKDDGQIERDYVSAIRVDVLNDVTEALKKLRSAETDRLTVVRAGLPFLKQGTVDLYAYGRAIDLAQRKMDYARSEGMVKLFNTNRKQFNLQLAEFVRFDAQRYDLQKGSERELAFATQTRDLGRRLSQLLAEQKLVSNLTLSEGQLNVELEKQGYYFGQLWQLRDSGHDDERSIELAKQLTAQNALNAAVERAIAAQREWNKSVQESKVGATLNNALRGLYARIKGGPALDRAIFEKQTRSELQARYDNGDFDVPTNTITTSLRAMRGVITAPQLLRDPLELEKRVQQALQGFDTKSATDRVAEANAKWTQMSLDLEQRQAELLRPLSELDKARLDFKTKGVAQSTEELDLQGKILAIARQLDNISLVPFRKQMGQQFQLGEIFDPKKRADLQLRFDHPEWSEETLNQILPVDRLLRKFTEAREQMQGLMDGWRDSWQNMFRDIAQKGQFSFGSFLDNITNRLAQWGADIISNAGWQALQGLLTKFAGGILRTNTMGSATVKYGTPDTVYGPTAVNNTLLRTTLAMSHDYMMQAARDLSAGATRSTASAMSGGENHNWNFTGATINVANGESLPEAAKRHVQKQNMSQPRGDSRRTLAKNGQQLIGVRR